MRDVALRQGRHAVQLARRTGAALVVAFCRRRVNNRYEAFVLPPVNLNDLPEGEADAVREGTRRLMHHIETFIRSDPAQWMLTTPLWEHEKPPR